MSGAVATLVSGAGMILVGCVAAWYWRRLTATPARWFWIGVGLWSVAVPAKIMTQLLCNGTVMAFLWSHLPHVSYVAAGSLFGGIESSTFEIGLTILAGLCWRELGRDAGRAVAIGVGAGAFEAVLLGLIPVLTGVASLAGAPGLEAASEQIRNAAATTPLFWLLGPVERMSAIICHMVTRGLALVGVRRGSAGMIALGFVIFSLFDTIASAVQLSGSLGLYSLWWIEALLALIAIPCLPLLRWLYSNFGHTSDVDEVPDTDVLAATAASGDAPTI
jgi:hypothetical protein